MLATFLVVAALQLTTQNRDEPPAPDDFVADPSWKPLGPSLWFEPRSRHLILRTQVVLREGALEHLLCLKGTKEHEAILATRAVPQRIHAGLLLTGAEPGHPVQFLPTFRPPAGTPIAIELEWKEGNQTRRADARTWVLDEKRNAPLKEDWVFAGSQIFEDPETKKPYYLADDGDLITVANFATAILDVPFASSAEDAGRLHVARTEAIPPMGTYVTMTLKPRTLPGKPAQER
ncbi:MAG: YdjY domain-containing protein [Isosphaeraceae bacterium]